MMSWTNIYWVVYFDSAVVAIVRIVRNYAGEEESPNILGIGLVRFVVGSKQVAYNAG